MISIFAFFKFILYRYTSEVGGDKELGTLAKDAFRAHVRSYATFPSDMKHIFHVKRLHLGKDSCTS